MTKKLFVVRKYIYAENAAEAIEQDRTKPVDDCWIDDDWKKEHLGEGEFGFKSKKKK